MFIYVDVVYIYTIWLTLISHILFFLFIPSIFYSIQFQVIPFLTCILYNQELLQGH